MSSPFSSLIHIGMFSDRPPALKFNDRFNIFGQHNTKIVIKIIEKS